MTALASTIIISFEFVEEGEREGKSIHLTLKTLLGKFHMYYTHGLELSYITTVTMEAEKYFYLGIYLSG